MTWLGGAVLVLAAFVNRTSQPLVARGLQDAGPQALAAWVSGKDLIGLSEDEVRRRLGAPSRKRPGVWEYEDWNLGPGYHTFIQVRVVRFQGGRVVSAPLEVRGVG